MASFSRQARAPAVSAVVLLSALGLSSCSGSAQACTAIGWSNALIVQFEGESAEVSDEPDWIRVGGSERCGGPHEATVTIEL